MARVIKRRLLEKNANDLPEQLHPILKRLYLAREIQSPEQLEYAVKRLIPPFSMSNMHAACELLSTAIQQQQSILIVADFDADGATSCAVACRALRLLGLQKVDYLVPDRFKYGYGLTAELVEVAKDKQPDLIITVDNGISSVQGVARAKELGIKVLVTDHHLPGPKLPEAEVIVNPNLPQDTFASKCIAGVGVIFYVMLALRSHLRQQAWFEQQGLEEPNLAHLLDLVALGTVADVVTLDHNNRIMVDQGLRRIRKGVAHVGIQALLDIAKRDKSQLTATDLAFGVAPRLNAAGRLEDMSIGIECLLTDDRDKAREIAQQLDELNKERKQIEFEMKELAMESMLESTEDMPFGLCVYQDDFHQGVVGIVASRLKEQFHRPVIVFAPTSDEEIKGSARSVQGVHIRDVLEAIHSQQDGLISKFGGHAMAAGLSLKKSNFDDFCQAFDEQVRRCLSEDQLKGIIHSDGELPNQDINTQLAQMIQAAGPWGQGFPEPLFDGEFKVLDQRIVGQRHLKLRLAQGSGQSLDAIAFGIDDQEIPTQGETIKAAYRLDVNDYYAPPKVQLIIEYFELLPN